MDELHRRRPMVHLVEVRARLLEDMLEAAGAREIEAVRLNKGAAFREARATCISCPHARECRAWLDNEASQARPAAEVALPSFCPNASFVASCRRGPTSEGYH